MVTEKRVTLLVLAVLVAAAPLVFPSAFYFRVGSLIFVNAIAVTGLVVLIGYAGQVSLGHAGFMGIGAYACALLPAHVGLHPALAGLAGAALSGLVAWAVGRPILRLKGYYLAVASLGFGILVSMSLANEAWLTGGPDGMAVPDAGLRDLTRAMGLGWSAAEGWYALCGLALLLAAWIALNLHDSPSGRALRALNGSEIAAGTVGIDVAKFKLDAFVVSAVYASVAGSLLALQNKYVTPDIAGALHSVELVTMTVLGGAASVPGAVLGAAILTTLPQALAVFQHYEQLMLGLVMMLVMIFLPAGLLPSLLKRLKERGR
ncbi:branched-chain amino acid ABC transporter permease [Aureimonas ureilytica]|uniref:Branched-chain amino acid ABC transporter permease n=2 Tax=Aureimonas ureilytica TaxID=401562 RepID=A0A175RA17_9HYPH|nr:branched-chain amino acid ABC transporter permease [Aureimonas ureilytica]KTQ96312.1 branched-chain amino acid ABC transporter permease [Aureimonas ureilytica]